ncbi:hypothetical protein CEXT_521601 [Caerostris extrusa]|uniref:Uncharacterized protein n=1 Tax=Caerostris extrusa TaxID=172846 RepID=A0AAV4XUD1_CAEEX|nr:hypothetical protein CEXT_521601 [Caerostris extrusa]
MLILVSHPKCTTIITKGVGISNTLHVFAHGHIPFIFNAKSNLMYMLPTRIINDSVLVYPCIMDECCSLSDESICDLNLNRYFQHLWLENITKEDV